MEPEEVNAEELGNNPVEGTPEQSEAEPTQPTEEVEETPEADPLASLPEEQREALIRAAQSRFTPAQQAKAEEARLAKEEARLAKEEARLEREQRLALARHMEELQGKVSAPAAPKEPEDPEPDPVMESAAWQKWNVRQELRPLVRKIQELESGNQMQIQRARQTAEVEKLKADYPDLKDKDSTLSKTFNAFLSSTDKDAVRLCGLYDSGHINAEELLAWATRTIAPAVAEAKVKQDLVRKANAQVAGGQSKAPPGKKYASVDDAINDAIRESMKG